MTDDNLIKSWHKRSLQYWSLLTQGATWMLSILGGFLLPPIGVLPTDEKVWMRLASLVTTALFGLMFVGCLKYNLKKHQYWWWIGSASLLACSISLFLIYQSISYSWTCEYNYHRILIGARLTPQAVQYVEKYGNQSCEFLLKSNAGEADEIWTRDSISARRTTLGSMYIGCISLFTSSIISVIQAVFIATKGTSKRRPGGFQLPNAAKSK